MLKKLVVTGCIEAVLLAVVAMVRPEFIQANAVWIAISALAILLAIAAYDAIRKPPKHEGPAQGGQATQGSHSPAFGNVGRDIHITNYAPHAEKPRRSSRGDIKIEAQRRCPKMPIAAALRYLMAVGLSKDAARLELQQAFSDGRMEAWGRFEIAPATLKAPQQARETWSHIGREYWDEFRLNENAFSNIDVLPQTEALDYVRKPLRRYWSLRVSEAELKCEWRGPSGSEDDEPERNWKTL